MEPGGAGKTYGIVASDEWLDLVGTGTSSKRLSDGEAVPTVPDVPVSGRMAGRGEGRFLTVAADPGHRQA